MNDLSEKRENNSRARKANRIKIKGAKRLTDNEALSTIAMKKLSEKQKIIQEQVKLTK